MDKKGIVIELIGLPGSGKSIINQEVAENYKKRGVKVESPTFDIYNKRALWRISLKLWFISREVIFHPLFFSKCLKYMLITRQKTIIDFLRVTVNLFYVLGIIRSKQNNRVTFLDQGIIQALWSVFYSSKGNLGELINKLPSLPLPDLVIRVNVLKEIALKRLEQRVYVQSRLETLEDGEKSAMLARAEEILQELESYLQQKAGFELLVVDNNSREDLQKARGSIESYVKARVYRNQLNR